MTQPPISTFVTDTEIWFHFFGKGAYLVFLLLYVLFAVILLRQVYLMTATLINTPLSLPLKTFALLHLGFAVLIFVLALIIL